MNRFMLKYASTDILKKFICTPHKKLGISKSYKLILISKILHYHNNNDAIINLLLNDRKNFSIRSKLIYLCRDVSTLEKIVRNSTYYDITRHIIRSDIFEHENIAIILAKHPCRFVRAKVSMSCRHTNVALELLSRDPEMIREILYNRYLSNYDKLMLIRCIDLNSISSNILEIVKKRVYQLDFFTAEICTHINSHDTINS